MHQGENALLLGVTSCEPANNKVLILEMCDKVKSKNISKIVEIAEPYPATKIQWFPQPTHDDYFATSSDILRLYKLTDDAR